MAAAFLWVVVVGGVGSWLFGYATGANDVGNAFGECPYAMMIDRGMLIYELCIEERTRGWTGAIYVLLA